MDNLNNTVSVIPQVNTQPEGNGTQAERTFTQEEVNRIVSERLSRERAKAEPTPEEQRLAELTAREETIVCKEFISNNNYPEQFLELYDTSSSEEFINNVNKLLKLFPSIIEPINFRAVASTRNASENKKDIFADIFKPKI
ncbi:MAG: hypothetical protein ACI4RN_07080 [Oscillospiraceae bacterium]